MHPYSRSRRGLRRSRYAVWSAALVVAAFTLQPATATTTTRLPTAFRHTTFSASHNTLVRFTLPRASTFHISPVLTSREIEVRGSGRIAGVVIAQDGVSATEGAMVFAFRFNGCWEAACRTPEGELLYPQSLVDGYRTTNVTASDGSRTMTLPAGAYKAYVVADGAPVTVSVDFSGASGTGRLASGTRAAAKLVSAESSLAGQPVQTQLLYSAGDTAPITSSMGMLVAVMEARSTMHASTAAGVCYYLDDQPPGGLFAPGCPGGTPSIPIVVNGVTPLHHGLEQISLTLAPGTWTQGVFLDGAHVPSSMSPSALLWLSLT